MSLQPVLHVDQAAIRLADAAAMTALTDAATAATFYRDDLDADQIAANRRVVEISGPSAVAAAESDEQMLAVAFVDGAPAGFVIATRHAADDLELDWLMVHPDFHGSGVAAALMRAGIDWLGPDRSLWLNVIRFNERAIRFYRRFGFEIDPEAPIEKAVPSWIMRRSARYVAG